MGLALQPARLPTRESCRPLTATERLDLPVFHKLSLLSGTAALTHVPADGARSRPLIVHAGQSYVAIVGPLSLEIKPLKQPASICGK